MQRESKEESMNAEKRHNILIRAPNWLGDLVLFTPALKALGSAFPAATFCVVGNAAARDIVSLCRPGFEFVYFDRHKAPIRRGDSGPNGERASREKKSISDSVGGGSWRATLSILRTRPWSTGITFAEGFSSALLLKLAGARRVFGYRGDSKRLLLSTALPRESLGRRPHLAKEFLALARAAGADRGDETPTLAIPADLLGTAKDFFDRHGLNPSGPIVGLCPGAAYGPSKRWPAEQFARAGAELANEGAAVAVFGAPSETSLAGEVTRAIPGAVCLAGETSVLTLAACLSQCSVVIANDSGAAHLAAAVGAAVVAVFSSSDPSWTRPLGERVRIKKAGLECAPCFEKECDLGYPCLTGVAPSDVAKTALELLQGTE
jgi:heptosyltransferase-2